AAATPKAHPAIPPPPALYGTARRNARGLALDDRAVRQGLMRRIEGALQRPVDAAPLIDGARRPGASRPVPAPADQARILGRVVEASARDVEAALQITFAAAPAWNAQGAVARAQILERASTLFEDNAAALLALLMGEGGKTLVNAQSELR